MAKLNRKGYEHARSLIKAGKVNKTAPWSISADEENRILGDPPDWDEYGRWFLGVDPDAPRDTKAHYKYPFGKNGVVYRSALVAIRQRAGQQKAGDIFEAAGRLLEMIDEEQVEGKCIFVCTDLKGTVPEEIQVIPYGHHETSKGEFVLDEEAAEAVIREFNRQKNDMVIDYEHQTLQGTEAPAAGWIKKLINKGKDGIWAVVEWTEKAKKYIANREYRYVSPVFLKRLSDNKVIKLINVALTNQPAIDGIVPLVNKLQISFNTTNKEGRKMKNLLKLLGLSEDATEEDAIQAVNKLKEQAESATKIVASKAVLEALDLQEGVSESEVVGTIMAMKQSHTQTEDLSKKVIDLSEKLAQREAKELVEQAMKEGKITPAQREWAEKYAKDDPEGFKVFVSKAPVVINMKKVAGDETPPEDAIDEVQMQVNKLLGIDEETFKKYNPKKEE